MSVTQKSILYIGELSKQYSELNSLFTKNDLKADFLSSIPETTEFLIKIQKYSLIILEISLIKGIDSKVYKQFQKALVHIPIIVIFSESNTDIYWNLSGFIIKDFIFKPYCNEELIFRINKAIDNNDIEKESFSKVEHIQINKLSLLNDYIRELNCFYEFSDLVNHSNTVEDIFNQLIYLLPSSFQFPDLIGIEMNFEDKKFVSHNFEDSGTCIENRIVAFEKDVGYVKICLLESHSEKFKTPFINEEIKLLDTITKHLGKIIERIKIKKELELSEKLFKDISHATGGWLWEVDKNGDYTYCSKNVVEVLGYHYTEILEKTAFDFIPPEETEKLKNYFADIVRHKKTIKDLEKWCITKSGKKICLMINGSPIIDDKGCLVSYRGVAKDITAQKKFENSLKKALNYIENIFHSVADMLIVIGADGIIKNVNKAVLDILGYAADEITGKSIVDIFVEAPEECAEGIKDFFKTTELKKHIHSGMIKNFETIFSTKFGGKIPISFSGSIMKGKDDELTGMIIFARDMSEVKKMEKIINDREATLRNMYDSKLMGFLLWDADSEILDSNKTFLKMLGYTKEEFFSKRVFWQDIVSEKYVQRDIQILSELAADKDVLPFEDEYICKDGHRISALVGATVLPDPGIGGAAFILDITERKKLEEKLRQSEKMEAIGQLSGGIAHDFNNILAVILANAEASLKNISNNETQIQNNLKEILSAGHHAKNVVKQLLFFARKTEIEKAPLKISYAISNALKLIKTTMPPSVILKTYIPRRTGYVFADPTQISQLIINLCTNAIHAMEEKGGVLGIKVSDITLDEKESLHYDNLKPGKYVRLIISDTGHGIAPEYKQQLFEPYFTTKPVDKGTGLGLAVTHGIVKDLKGDISVESKPGKGTVFSILFPQTDKIPVNVYNKTVIQKLENPENIKILLIDDEEAVLKSMKLLLGMRGFAVTGKTNAVEALELLRSDPYQFDLIITDMTMPLMTGDQLAIEALRICSNIPIILCTGFNEKIDEKTAKTIGISRYIEKPFSEKEISRIINEILTGSE